MKTSTKGLKLIKSHEGLRLKAYKCPADVWTIGYGSTTGVKPNDVVTNKQAEELLAKDLATAEAEVNRHKLPLNQNQFDALVSFIFNVGSGNFRKSTLLKRIQENVFHPNIPFQFSRWDKGGGKVLPGLVRRRKDEAILYFKQCDCKQ